MTGVDLMLEIQAKEELLEQATQDLFKLSQLAPELARDFRKERGKRMLTLRADGVPVSILKDVAEGEDGIADKKCEADAAENMLSTTKEYINVLKLELNILKEQVQREWTS